MYRILFTVPGLNLSIHSFSVVVLLAVAAALYLTAWRAKREGLDPGVVSELAVWLLTGGIIGARVFYIIQHPESIQRFSDLFMVWQGGLVYYGCLIGGLIGSVLYWVRHPFPFVAMADAVAPALAIGCAIGRVGCLLNGCCYGDPCHLPWAIQFPAESFPWYRQVEQGLIAPFDSWTLPLHPTQLYAVLDGLFILGLLTTFYPRRRRDGEVMALLMVTYPITRFVIEGLRGDEGVFLLGMTMSQGISVVVFVAGLGAWGLLLRQPHARLADRVTTLPARPHAASLEVRADTAPVS